MAQGANSMRGTFSKRVVKLTLTLAVILGLTMASVPTPFEAASGPTITVHPRDCYVVAGGGPLFAVVASGTRPLTYQWQKNTVKAWVDIPGATKASYSTWPVTLSDSGTRYRVVVSNGSGSLISSEAILQVQGTPTAPWITAQPALSMDQIPVIPPKGATFYVSATNSNPGDPVPLYYQWQKYNETAGTWLDLPGETNGYLTISPTSVSDSGSQYRVKVWNLTGLYAEPQMTIST